MTDATTTDVQADESKTVKLPGGGSAIRLPNDELADPVHVSVKSLVRLGQGSYDAIIGWVEDERQRAAAQQAEREAQQAAASAEIRRDAEMREAVREQWLAEHPWERVA
jgi:hypothetical protein